MTFPRVKTESSLTELFQVRLAEALPASPMGSRVVINNSSCTSETKKVPVLEHGYSGITTEITAVVLLRLVQRLKIRTCGLQLRLSGVPIVAPSEGP